ncbi:hypothetical protein DY052_05925 [Apilactobacillus timberlakei]|uniref:hypothetical protein n=1 Tax=Apilactobacillus timberlakei TaxID=2008380 RepID=UPI00112DD873|nr:hypothetical protein [Apilactobacillus timberlakei]TPR14961.1 hypothetical protein DY052_05925 [Apilactobacillus timberlakei]
MKNFITFILMIIPTSISIAILFIVFSNVYNSNTINNYSFQAAQIISHTGGLNKDAKAKIDEMSKNDFKGMFSISSDQENVPYRNNITYHISVKLPVQTIFQGLDGYSHFDQVYRTKSLVRNNSLYYDN